MKNNIFLYVLIMLVQEPFTIDFTNPSVITNWRQTNDDVMGGVSSSKMVLDQKGNGVFLGTVSTKNNGGFAMTCFPLRVNFPENITKVILHLKGDGKRYQFRLKSDIKQRFSYVQYFQTTTEKEQIVLLLKDFYPAFRGRTLNKENFSGNQIKEIAILIGNKKDEEFKLMIDKIIIE
ncbi:conserved hypothetical protein [Tenacibaculum maritimum]|uniref:CIA30 family protein n=1 Tax=Tenacibaculum maritimum TaxID=107401 RepID=UPI0012E5313B|nr:CIA30 family protein [Tenacibaculum maritimum]CAA0143526.1 conserved hypothetical protein [Tenacibaculum maritimum]CAA0144179.1 conserved hypothetical protein [Tenacibaculum maritimum]CAA0208780.1 conserved hypothetical protein [Tenacibaculum maritimum]